MTAIPQERRIVTAIPGPKSRELQARRTATVAGGVGSVLPVFAARADGGVVEDVDGNRFIDFGSGIAVTSVGASAEAVVRRASAQLADFTHTCFMVTPYEGYVEVCERLAELTPGDHAKKSALFNSGAEAVENAVKIARAYTKRQAVVVFDHGYHGRTNLTMALTSKNMPYKNGFGPFAPEVYRVPVAYGYRWPTGPENCGPEASAQAIDQISKQVGAENVAAIIIEPVLGEGGFIEPHEGLPARAGEVRERQRDRVRGGRDPVRLLPHRPVVRERGRGCRPGPDHHGQGHRGRPAARRRHRPRRDHGRRARGRARRYVRR